MAEYIDIRNPKEPKCAYPYPGSRITSQETHDSLEAERTAREAAERRIRELEAQLLRNQNGDSS